MSDLIVTKNQPRLPRAIAKGKDGITLYWVEELGIAGIHSRGIEALLKVESDLVRNVIASLQGARQIDLLEVEVLTGGGIQGARLVVESDLPKVLRSIERSKAKEETRDRAGDIRDRLAAAGFKLMVMLELAPQQLLQAIAPTQPVLPQTYLEALKALVAATEREEAALAQLEAAKPAIEFAEAIAVSDETIDFNEFAKLIGTGRTRLFREMRKAGVILQQSNLPYQKWMDAGYFEVTEIVGANGVNVYALVTGKGQLWLQQRLGIHGKNTTFVEQLDLLEE